MPNDYIRVGVRVINSVHSCYVELYCLDTGKRIGRQTACQVKSEIDNYMVATMTVICERDAPSKPNA